MCLRVVSSVCSSEDKREAKPVDEASLLEANGQFVSVLLSLDVVGLLEIVLQGAGVHPSNHEIVLCEFKYLIEHCKIGFFLFGEHHSLPESCICECFGDEVEEFALALELPFVVVEEVRHVSVSAIDAVDDLALHVLC